MYITNRVEGGNNYYYGSIRNMSTSNWNVLLSSWDASIISEISLSFFEAYACRCTWRNVRFFFISEKHNTIIQPRASGQLFCPGFNEIPYFCSWGEALVSLSVFESHIFFHQSSHLFLYTVYSHIQSYHVTRIWSLHGLIFNILFQTCWLHLFLNR